MSEYFPSAYIRLSDIIMLRSSEFILEFCLTAFWYFMSENIVTFWVKFYWYDLQFSALPLNF